MSARALLLALAGGVVLCLAGCRATGDQPSESDAIARAMVGFRESDVLMCAGFPTRQSEEGRLKVWSYELTRQGSGVTVSTPLIFGTSNTSLSLRAGSTCRVQIRFVDGKADRVVFAGESMTPLREGDDCVEVVRACAAYARNRPANPPPLPEQPATAGTRKPAAAAPRRPGS